MNIRFSPGVVMPSRTLSASTITSRILHADHDAFESGEWAMPVSILDIGGPLITIAPGATLTITYWFGNSEDVGVCYATLATQPEFAGALDVLDQGREGFRQALSPSGFIQFANTNSWNYRMRVVHRKPVGPRPAVFNIRVAVLTKG